MEMDETIQRVRNVLLSDTDQKGSDAEMVRIHARDDDRFPDAENVKDALSWLQVNGEATNDEDKWFPTDKLLYDPIVMREDIETLKYTIEELRRELENVRNASDNNSSEIGYINRHF